MNNLQDTGSETQRTVVLTSRSTLDTAQTFSKGNQGTRCHIAYISGRYDCHYVSVTGATPPVERDEVPWNGKVIMVLLRSHMAVPRELSFSRSLV